MNMSQQNKQLLDDIPFEVDKQDEWNAFFNSLPSEPESTPEKPKIHIDVKDKYLMTIEEASEYFNIGQSKLRNMIKLDPYNNYTIKNGNRTLIKRFVFEDYLDSCSSI